MPAPAVEWAPTAHFSPAGELGSVSPDRDVRVRGRHGVQWLLRTGRCLGLACGQRRREVLPAGAGWGGISSDDLPPGRDCWVSFAVIDMPGYRFLEEGDVVDVTCTASKQDSWDVVADRVRTV